MVTSERGVPGSFLQSEPSGGGVVPGPAAGQDDGSVVGMTSRPRPAWPGGSSSTFGPYRSMLCTTTLGRSTPTSTSNRHRLIRCI